MPKKIEGKSYWFESWGGKPVYKTNGRLETVSEQDLPPNSWPTVKVTIT
jgi:hypothetical protein